MLKKLDRFAFNFFASWCFHYSHIYPLQLRMWPIHVTAALWSIGEVTISKLLVLHMLLRITLHSAWIMTLPPYELILQNACPMRTFWLFMKPAKLFSEKCILRSVYRNTSDVLNMKTAVRIVGKLFPYIFNYVSELHPEPCSQKSLPNQFHVAHLALFLHHICPPPYHSTSHVSTCTYNKPMYNKDNLGFSEPIVSQRLTIMGGFVINFVYHNVTDM